MPSCQYFLKLSGIPDEKGRAGHYPGRLEAERRPPHRLQRHNVTPWEDSSVERPLAARPPNSQLRHSIKPCEHEGYGLSPYIQPIHPTGALAPEQCTPALAEWTWSGVPGRLQHRRSIFDLQGGAANSLSPSTASPKHLGKPTPNLPSKRPNGDNSTRHHHPQHRPQARDTIRVKGHSRRLRPRRPRTTSS